MKNVSPLLTETYLALVKNSVGTEMFKNLYANVDGAKTDITENGNLSCSFFVSSLLLVVKLIKEPHATVDGTVRDLKTSGWIEIEKPKLGCMLVWEKSDFGENGLHKHIGFYVGEDKAISNNSKTGKVFEHHFTFENSRQIESILWNPKLD